jgi:hypothetical protein
VRKYIVSENSIFWPCPVSSRCSLLLFCMHFLVVNSTGVLSSSKTIEFSPTERVGTSVLPAEQLVV